MPRPAVRASFGRACVSSPRRWFRAGLVLAVWLTVARVGAGVLETLFRHNVEVITVTDVTPEGKLWKQPSPGHPLRYSLVYVGETVFGRSWQGEELPKNGEALRWLGAELRRQGFELATAEHQPDVVIVYGWGLLTGGSGRTAFGFLGGEKLDLMWLQSAPSPFSISTGTLDSRLFVKDAYLGGVAGRIWALAEDNLFLCVVRCYTPESLYGDKTTKLWETRFACPATGLSLRNVMPLLIRAAGPHFGHDTPKPVALDATAAFKGEVKLGDLRVMDDNAPPAPPPSSDDKSGSK